MNQASLSVTVALPRPMRGSQLMEVVKAAVEDGIDEYHPVHFIAKPGDVDRGVFTIGQYSMNEHDQIMVAPAKDVTDINRRQRYTSVEIASHIWPFGHRYANSYDEDLAAGAVEKLAVNMQRRLADVPADLTVGRFGSGSSSSSFVQKLARIFRQER